MGTPEKPLVFRFRHTVVKGFVWVCWTISLMLWALFDRSHPLAPLVGSLSFAAFAIAGMFARRNARLEFDGQAFSVYDWSGKVEATGPGEEGWRRLDRLLFFDHSWKHKHVIINRSR